MNDSDDTTQAEGNVAALPKDRGVPLFPMDREQAAYHRQNLRAVADLIEAGEPICWSEPFHSTELALVQIYVPKAALRAAERNVRMRVKEGDGEYVIKVEHRPAERRDRRGRPY